MEGEGGEERKKTPLSPPQKQTQLLYSSTREQLNILLRSTPRTDRIILLNYLPELECP